MMTANAIAEGREGRMQHLLTEYRRMQSPEALSVKNKNQYLLARFARLGPLCGLTTAITSHSQLRIAVELVVLRA